VFCLVLGCSHVACVANYTGRQFLSSMDASCNEYTMIRVLVRDIGGNCQRRRIRSSRASILLFLHIWWGIFTNYRIDFTRVQKIGVGCTALTVIVDATAPSHVYPASSERTNHAADVACLPSHPAVPDHIPTILSCVNASEGSNENQLGRRWANQEGVVRNNSSTQGSLILIR
jgi:hypothetical protein